MLPQDLEKEIYDYLEEFDMIRKNTENDKEYIIMPIAFKIKSKYPKEFIEN